MPAVSRPYESAANLRLMQSLQQELWAIERERTHTHVGDPYAAWAWLDRPASLDCMTELRKER